MLRTASGSCTEAGLAAARTSQEHQQIPGQPVQEPVNQPKPDPTGPGTTDDGGAETEAQDGNRAQADRSQSVSEAIHESNSTEDGSTQLDTKTSILQPHAETRYSYATAKDSSS